MRVFFIHFFEKPVESEYTINKMRDELKFIGLDEFHFQSAGNYSNKVWKVKSVKEIESSDCVIFLYSSTSNTNPDKFANVEYELKVAFDNKKIVFFIPIDPDNPEYENHIKNYSEGMPRIGRFNNTDGRVIVTSHNDFIRYISSTEHNRTSSVPKNCEAIEKLVKTIEDGYGIESKNSLSTFYNKIQIDLAIKEKITKRMLNDNINNPDSLAIQYESMFNSIENLDERRQTNNTVYTTINTALIALVAASISIIMSNFYKLTGFALIFMMFVMIPLVGIRICKSWENTLKRYKDLRSVKFETLELIEEHLPLNLNKAEWEVLKSKHYVTASEDAKLPSQMKWLYVVFVSSGLLLMLLSLLGIMGIYAL